MRGRKTGKGSQLQAAGETILDEDLARISPLMYQHVIPNGTYHYLPVLSRGMKLPETRYRTFSHGCCRYPYFAPVR